MISSARPAASARRRERDSAAVGCPGKSSAPRESGSQPDGPQLVIVARASQAWVQQSAGICPKSRRDGFARDCPLRHPVAWVLALRDRAGAHRRFLVVCGAISVLAEGVPGIGTPPGVRWCPMGSRSSREPSFVVRIGGANLPPEGTRTGCPGRAHDTQHHRWKPSKSSETADGSTESVGLMKDTPTSRH